MLYKYRSLENYKYFVDIIIKERLYAANYKELNDPMEGQYLYSNTPTSNRFSEIITNLKQQIRIVSLSREENHPLMWAHYANGHRGVAIGVEVDENVNFVKKINYTSSFLKLEDFEGLPDIEVARTILSNKINVWSYEQEERILVEDNSFFARVKVCEVIAGRNMSNQDYSLMKELVNRLNPNIAVRRANNYIDEINW